MTETREWRDRPQDPSGYAALHQRLSSMDASIVEIRGLLERIVKVEVRLQGSLDCLMSIQAHLAAVDHRLMAVEKLSDHSNWVVGSVERFGWLVVAVAAAWFSARF